MSYILASEPPLDPPEPEVAFYCDCCGEPVYVGEEYYNMEDPYFPFDGDRVCADCIIDYIGKRHKAIAEKPEPDYEEDDTW